MNRELLARVRDRIADVGNDHCEMDSWSDGVMVGNGPPTCGTTACIAGHALAVHLGRFEAYGRDREWESEHAISTTAQIALGLPSQDVFDRYSWPEYYQRLLEDEGDAKGMLAVCDALLDGALIFDADGELIENP